MSERLPLTLLCILLVTLAAIIGILFGLAIGDGPTPEPEKDACRAEIEQAYAAFQNDQHELARDLLLDAFGATCISEIQ